jgi:dipeptidyl aminopeptidase
MAKADELTDEQSQPLTHHDDAISRPETPRRSISSVSTTSLVLENVSHKAAREFLCRDGPQQDHMYIDDQLAWQQSVKPADRRVRSVLYGLIALGVIGWVAALFLFLGQDRHIPHSARPHNPHATSTVGNGKKVTLDQVLTGQWYANSHAIRWIAGAEEGEDGLLLERNGGVGRDFLVVEDVRYRGEALSGSVRTRSAHPRHGQAQTTRKSSSRVIPKNSTATAALAGTGSSTSKSRWASLSIQATWMVVCRQLAGRPKEMP